MWKRRFRGIHSCLIICGRTRSNETRAVAHCRRRHFVCRGLCRRIAAQKAALFLIEEGVPLLQPGALKSWAARLCCEAAKQMCAANQEAKGNPAKAWGRKMTEAICISSIHGMLGAPRCVVSLRIASNTTHCAKARAACQVGVARGRGLPAAKRLAACRARSQVLRLRKSAVATRDVEAFRCLVAEQPAQGEEARR